MPKSARPLNLSAGQAQFVLERLVTDGRVSRHVVDTYVDQIGREVAEIEERLRRLRELTAGGRLPARAGRRAAVAAQRVPSAKRRRRRQAPMTPARRASQKLQGQYLGLIRQVPKNRRGTFAKIAQEKGREAAIAAMRKQLRK